MLRMSAGNLFKRKLRTVLTILGVVIGTAAIVVMISIGIGMSRGIMEQYEQYGSMKEISVSPNYNNADSKDPTSTYFSKSDLATFAAIEHVQIVSPILNVSAQAYCGKYESFLNLTGMTLAALREKDLDFKYGTYPEEGDALGLIYGNMVQIDFNNPKRPRDNYWSTGKAPDIDLVNDTVKLIFDTAQLSAYQADTTGKEAKPKSYAIETDGLLAGEPGEFNGDSFSVYCDVEALESMLRKVFKDKAIPNQPLTKSGKPYKEFYYNSVQVIVDDMNAVADVQKKISDMGYMASSNMEWVQQAQQQFAYIEAVLGGIGGVAMLIAAISITNTMMMSIYERTKEIGIMKVLGCNMHNIQTMFLFEAGFIGFIGGILGTGLSYLASGIINVLSKGESMMGMGESMSGISYIPPWLGLLGILFAIVVSTLAGFFPSLRAMRLSPLAAIRND